MTGTMPGGMDVRMRRMRDFNPEKRASMRHGV